MLYVVNALDQLKFSELMCVYADAIRENGAEFYSNLSDAEQLCEAEQDFYRYLKSVFFRQKESAYCIWEDAGGYCCALRLEPYADGFLLCGLETKPEERRKGYAEKLVFAVQQWLSEKGNVCLYSHVSKLNEPSLLLHKKCGFDIIKDFAVYSDGSVLNSSYTLIFICRKSESSL